MESTDFEVSDLQDEILQQSRQIESYIAKKKHTAKDDSFQILLTLFSMFKSELSVNLALRRQLIAEKDRSAQIDEESGRTGKKIKALKLQLDQAEQRIRSLEDENRSLKERVDSLNNENEMFQIAEAERMMNPEKDLEQENQMLREKVKKGKEKLTKALRLHETEIEAMKQKLLRVDELEDQNARLRENLKKLSTSIEEYERRNAELEVMNKQ